MSDGSDSNALGWLIGGTGGVAIAAAARWVWDKLTLHHDAREKKIEERESDYVAKMEARLGAVELLVKAQTSIIHDQGRELERHRLALALLINDVATHRPTASVLEQVKAILGSAFPLIMPTPGDINDLASRIE